MSRMFMSEMNNQTQSISYQLLFTSRTAQMTIDTNSVIYSQNFSQTTTSNSLLSSFQSFDNNTLDSLSDFDGISINFPRYIYPGTNGYGSALSFNRIIGQFVQI